MSTYFSRLKLSVQAPLNLKDLTYKFVVTNNSTKKKLHLMVDLTGKG